ncbi:MAG: 4Fe-4S dicluster domain-containing protein [Deltaproteobacteria bacterium]|nr:4Fe-4S dicluster domain-containing protein [Deltaproteobacteria bacterium]MBW1929673.1 4Fe-4S dicluster domain-containing protein [Deltaproteobacteria bacterium]MBW2025260.1 4Fe-4S dicluster domain-containing protein [Deltaproteobacteria bacterium]MBW2125164.1 4Fe-4S dicluster domain-containing protein [Deltaproteobacteria bacterium]RLB24859.1 MAG: hypothetical protein DRG76_00125 [Deltaproteobacteria bacterium]
MKKGKKPKGIPLPSATISLPRPLKADIRPNKLVFPLTSRWGNLTPAVKSGDDISEGQLLAMDSRGVAPPIFSPCSGKVTGITPWTNFSGQDSPSIIIQCSSVPQHSTGAKLGVSWREMDIHTLIKKIHKSGIREADSYRWPLAWRLAQPGLPPVESEHNGPDISRPIDFLIINALDRQPGVFVRQAALGTMETEIADSISLLERVSGARNTVLAVWKDQYIPDSLETELGQRGINVAMCPNIYPIALEPLLIRYITGRDVPQPKGDPREVGVVVVDMVTALRVYRAVRDNQPATNILVQINAPAAGIDYQQWVPEGMLVSELLDQLPSRPKNTSKLLLGGPFLGFAQHTFDVPITGNVDSIIIQSLGEVSTFENRACINCGHCVKVCPMGLLPNDLSRLCEYGKFEAAEKNYLFYCIECGLCAYVCPAKRPMVHFIRFGKQEVERMRETSQ